MSIAVRPARPDDYDFARRLHHETMRPYCLAYFDWIDADQDARFRGNFRIDEAFVITSDDRTVGWFAVQETADEIILGQIFIRPELQRHGIGTSILNDLISRSRASRRSLALSVLKNNPARNLYERLGFEIVGENEIKFFMRYDSGKGL